jgi:hypothetical protein
MTGGAVRHDPPDLPSRKSSTRLSIEQLQPGDWLDTGMAPGRNTTKKLCSITAQVKLETGHRYTVRADGPRHTTWVHCLDPQA